MKDRYRFGESLIKIYYFLTIAIFTVLMNPSPADAVQLQASWNASEGVVDGYRIYYREKTETNAAYIMTWEGTETTTTLDIPLKENIPYIFIVRAYNSTGESDDSNSQEYTQTDNEQNSGDLESSQKILLTALGIYGNRVSGGETFQGDVNFTFEGINGVVTISFSPYDVDMNDEIAIMINGQLAAYATTTGDNAWGSVQNVVLPDESVNDNSENIITFRCTKNPPKNYMWGVKDITVVGPLLLPAFGVYGNRVPGGETYKNEVKFSFDGMSGDTSIRYFAYDADIDHEIEIKINGHHAGYASMTADNSWGDEQIIVLSDEYVNDNASNLLTFSCTSNPPKNYMWGVRTVQLD